MVARTPSSEIAQRLAKYKENVAVDAAVTEGSKFQSIKTERKKHVVTQSEEKREKCATVIEANVEAKKANSFDALMEQLGGGCPGGTTSTSSTSGSGETTTTCSSSGDKNDSSKAESALNIADDSSKNPTTNNNVLSMNNSQAFERIDRREHNEKALNKLHAQYEAFVRHVATNCTNVDTVEMAHCQLTDKFAELVAEHWLSPGSKLKLVSLNLESNLFQEAGVMALAKAAAHNKTLTSVFLRHQSAKGTVSSPAAEAWCQAVQANTKIIRCGVDMALSQHVHALRQHLNRNQDLQRQARRQERIRSGGNKIQPLDSAERRRIRAVAADDPGATADPNEGIFRFPDSEKRSFKALKSAEKADLGKAFAGNTKFHTADLQSLELDDAFGLALAESLRENASLRIIDLSSNRLTSKSLDAIAQVLRDDNRTLKEFKLLNQTPATGVVRKTEALLAEAVGRNPVLTKLALSKWTDSFARDQVDKKLMANKWSKK